jgi:hypothetical protein
MQVGLESRCGLRVTVGSNPTPSASGPALNPPRNLPRARRRTQTLRAPIPRPSCEGPPSTSAGLIVGATRPGVLASPASRGDGCGAEHSSREDHQVPDRALAVALAGPVHPAAGAGVNVRAGPASQVVGGEWGHVLILREAGCNGLGDRLTKTWRSAIGHTDHAQGPPARTRGRCARRRPRGAGRSTERPVAVGSLGDRSRRHPRPLLAADGGRREPKSQLRRTAQDVVVIRPGGRCCRRYRRRRVILMADNRLSARSDSTWTDVLRAVAARKRREETEVEDPRPLVLQA